MNVGTDELGTAILTKNSISFERVEMLPNGRGMSGVYHNTYFINVYAPSGTNKRKERNDFYQNEIPYLFRTLPSQYILGGDFNCVLNKDDTTGTFQQSSTLQELVTNLNMKDAWINCHNNIQYGTLSSPVQLHLE